MATKTLYKKKIDKKVEKELMESMKRKEKGIPLETVDIKSN
jgi:hypothetical protein